MYVHLCTFVSVCATRHTCAYRYPLVSQRPSRGSGEQPTFARALALHLSLTQVQMLYLHMYTRTRRHAPPAALPRRRPLRRSRSASSARCCRGFQSALREASSARGAPPLYPPCVCIYTCVCVYVYVYMFVYTCSDLQILSLLRKNIKHWRMQGNPDQPLQEKYSIYICSHTRACL
jgi:hypothetical protein